jgi:hypothetical protein
LKKELTDANLAHGDLQHANVMVTDNNELKLVDYDCMCVPELAGQRNLEIGVVPYQHPMRGDDTLLSTELDNFSAIFIYVVLRALAADPGLWATHVESDNYDKLLIRHEDFEAPKSSELYRALLNSPDPDVGRMAKDLFALYRKHIDEVPRLEAFVFSYDTIRDALAKKDFDAVVKLLTKKGDTDDAPQDLVPLIKNAHHRVKRRKELEAKVAAGDEPGMQKLYDPRLLDDYPKAQPAAAHARHASQVVPVLQELRIAKQGKQWRDLVRIWDSHLELIADRKSAAPFKVDVENAQRRNQACDIVLQLIRKPSQDINRLAQSWKLLKELDGHPDVDDKRTEFDEIVNREVAWEKFQQSLLAASSSEESDSRLVTTWDDHLFKGWEKAKPERPKAVAAVQRLNQLTKLRRQSERQHTIADEQGVVQLAAKLPRGYQHSLSSRVDLAQKRLDAHGLLSRSLEGSPSDVAIVAATEKLRAAQGEGLLDPPTAERVRLAERRLPLLNRLKQLSQTMVVNQLDSNLLSIWDDSLLSDCHDADPWRPGYETAVRRKTLLDQLAHAIAIKDKPRIIEITGESCLRDYPFNSAWQKITEDARQEIESANAMIDALRTQNKDDFRDLFNARSIRTYPQLFQPFEDQVVAWTNDFIRRREAIGLTNPPATKSLVAEGHRNSYLVRWKFPLPRYTDQCYLTISRARPGPETDFDALQVSLKAPVNRELYEGAGGRKIHPSHDANGFYIAVWAIIDLGFAKVTSEPFVVGRIGQRAPGGERSRR